MVADNEADLDLCGFTAGSGEVDHVGILAFFRGSGTCHVLVLVARFRSVALEREGGDVSEVHTGDGLAFVDHELVDVGGTGKGIHQCGARHGTSRGVYDFPSGVGIACMPKVEHVLAGNSAHEVQRSGRG